MMTDRRRVWVWGRSRPGLVAGLVVLSLVGLIGAEVTAVGRSAIGSVLGASRPEGRAGRAERARAHIAARGGGPVQQARRGAQMGARAQDPAPGADADGGLDTRSDREGAGPASDMSAQETDVVREARDARGDRGNNAGSAGGRDVTVSGPLPAGYRAPAVTVEADVAYGPDPAQRLDLYLPLPAGIEPGNATDSAVGQSPTQSPGPVTTTEAALGQGDGRGLGENRSGGRAPRREPLAVLVWIHGGSWQGGDKALMVPDMVLRQVSRRQVAVASINYRLVRSSSPGWAGMSPIVPGTGINQWPVPMYDVDRALRWLKVNAPHWGLDPDRVVVWGHSAGGQLATMAAVAAGVFTDPELEAELQEVDPRPLAYVSYGARTSLGSALGAHPAGKAAVEALLNCGSGPCTGEALVDASAVHYLDGHDPPGYVACGRADRLVPCATQAEPFAALAALVRGDLGRVEAERGVRLEVTGGGHDMDPQALDVLGFESTWLDPVLSGQLG